MVKVSVEVGNASSSLMVGGSVVSTWWMMGVVHGARVGDGEGPEAAAGAGAGDGARGTGARAADGDWLEEGDGVGATPVTEGIS